MPGPARRPRRLLEARLCQVHAGDALLAHLQQGPRDSVSTRKTATRLVITPPGARVIRAPPPPLGSISSMRLRTARSHEPGRVEELWAWARRGGRKGAAPVRDTSVQQASCGAVVAAVAHSPRHRSFRVGSVPCVTV